MRSLHVVALIVIASASAARAQSAGPEAATTLDDDAHTGIEVGAYTGTFISNYYHQFYQLDKFPSAEGEAGYRPELRRFSPLAGLRVAYFFLPWLGAEADLNLVMAETQERFDHPRREPAKIYNGRVQLMFQATKLSSVFVPYISIGTGFSHLASTYLGSDTDYPPFVGGGARLRVTPSLTVRVDGRWMRAPTPQEPYTLNCNLGELMVGVSFRPTRGASDPPAPASTDGDGDGIVDEIDRCPTQPEDKDLFDDSDGCLDLDNDGDAIADARDKCPLDPEDKDDFQDDDGCVDKDNDNDGIADLQDRCVRDAEDFDAYRDADGCPDLDNDADGFADAADKCPNEAEVINGISDEDGCADRGNGLVVISPDRFELLEHVEFKNTTIHKKSFNVLGQIAATLRAHPEILRVRITVHVQPTNSPEQDRVLSERRALAIHDWLVDRGIEEKRLEPRGFGSTKPLVAASTKGSKAINERIDFIILERK